MKDIDNKNDKTVRKSVLLRESDISYLKSHPTYQGNLSYVLRQVLKEHKELRDAINKK